MLNEIGKMMFYDNLKPDCKKTIYHTEELGRISLVKVEPPNCLST
jgi:hypothetical protein